MILFGVLQKYIDTVSNKIFIPIVIMLFLLTLGIQYGFVGIPNLLEINLPNKMYDLDFLFPFGFTSNDFFSADYFPLFPWFFCFLLGSCFGKWLKSNKAPEFFYKSHLKFLSFVGRNTLIIYVLHQPILFGLFYFVSMVV